jgi:hypothetical protein
MMPVLDGLELMLDVDSVLRGQGANPATIRARGTRLVRAAEKALAEGRSLLQPAVLYEEFTVESVRHQSLHLAGGATLRGDLVAQQLGPAERVIAVICTIGGALEEHTSQAMAQDPVHALALDGVGGAAVEALANAACQQFAASAAAEGRQTTVPFSPGMVGWPLLDGQRQIFALLDARQIGVVLTADGLMIPEKSLSMVLGTGRHVESTGRSCDYCTMRETCRYRSRDD